MRKIGSREICGIDEHDCLASFNQESHKLGITEQDIISIQRVVNDKPELNTRDNKKNGYVSLYFFYWLPPEK